MLQQNSESTVDKDVEEVEEAATNLEDETEMEQAENICERLGLKPVNAECDSESSEESESELEIEYEYELCRIWLKVVLLLFTK